MKKGVIRNLTKFTGKPLCQSLFFNKVAGLRLATLLKKRFWHWCFPVNFVKFLRTPFLQNTSGRLLLYLHSFLFYNNNFILTKALVLAKNVRTSLEQSHACCPEEHKNRRSRIAISKIIRTTSEQSLAVTYIVLHVCQFYSHT